MGSGTYGNVDFFGLDEFGMPVGLPYTLGAAAGPAIAAGTAVAVRKYSTDADYQKYSELIGAGVALLAGAALWVSPKTRAAGVTAAISGAVGNVIRQIEHSMAMSTVSTGVKGLYGLREVTMEPRTALKGLGMVSTEPRTALQGFGAVRRPTLIGNGGPPSLQDAGFAANPAARHVQLIGGPAMSQTSNLYGSTHFNKN